MVRTYTIQQFLANEHHKELKIIDHVIGHLMKNKELYMQIVFILALVGLRCDISYAGGIDTLLNKVDAIGINWLKVVRRGGYWLIAIKGSAEVVQTGMNGDSQTAIKIVIKYLLLYASLFMLIYGLDAIKEGF